MELRGRELYREVTGWGGWVYILMWGVMIGSALLILFAPGKGGEWTEPGRLWSAGTTVALMAAIQYVFGGLTVVVHADGIRVGLGKGWPFRTWLPLSEIDELESVTYRPLREFGGWGLRGSRTKRAWTARGNRAVVLTMKDGRRVYIGSDEPSKLEGRIRMAMTTMRHG